jgi:hypothetical protein
MAKSVETVKREINEHIQNRGGAYSDWYVGIASDPRDRLFNDHNVSKENGHWVFRECENADDARDVEYYFVYTLRTDGGPGGGDNTTKYVYAYRKTSRTKQRG